MGLLEHFSPGLLELIEIFFVAVMLPFHPRLSSTNTSFAMSHTLAKATTSDRVPWCKPGRRYHQDTQPRTWEMLCKARGEARVSARGDKGEGECKELTSLFPLRLFAIIKAGDCLCDPGCEVPVARRRIDRLVGTGSGSTSVYSPRNFGHN